MKRRALQISPNDHPPFGDICDGFEAALRQLGYAVTTVFFAAAGPSPAPTTRRYLAPPLNHLAEGTPFDLVLTHRYKGYLAGVAVPSRMQLSLSHGFGMFKRRRRRWRRRLVRRRVAFAGVSTAVADEMAQHLGRPCVTLPNPIDVAALRAGLIDRPAARRALGLEAEGYLVGVVGRLHWWKRPLLAVEGFRRARALLGPAAKLVFLGDGALAANIPRRPDITLAGFVPDAWRYLRAFDVVLSTSSRREAFGMSLVEALAAEVPVVCADQPGPREALGGCARFFDGDDTEALAKALGATRYSPNDALSAAGHRHVVDNLSVRATASRLAALVDGAG